MRRSLSLRKAFTLVELLVVIGIIALLISILLPALGRVRGQANALKCATQMRGIGQLFLLYSNANKGWIYPNPKGDGVLLGGAVPQNERWPTLIFDDEMRRGLLNAANHYYPPAMKCPTDNLDILDGGDNDPYGAYHSYNPNVSLFPQTKLKNWVKYGGSVPRYGNSDVILLCEKIQNRHESHIDADPNTPQNGQTVKSQWYTLLFNQTVNSATWDPASPGAGNEPKYKHGKSGNNYLFLDFSVRNEVPKMVDPAKQFAPHNYFYSGYPFP